MKFYIAALKKRPIVLASLLLIAATGSMAMSLGQNRGAALVGRPLNISVQAALDAQDDSTNLCLDADVFYADNKLEKSRTQVTAEKTPGSSSAQIHIRSSVLVDEPVVTVYLRAGCQQKSEKRYVLLADLVSEVAVSQPSGMATAAGAAIPTPGLRAVPLATASSVAVSARSASRPRPDAVVSVQPGSINVLNQAKVKVEAPSAPAQASSRQALRSKDARVAEKSRPRLKLEPLDLTIERDPVLKSSTELLSAPASSDQERSVAAALWRALTAQPQDILRDAEKIQALENSVQSLRAQTQKNQLAINDLNGQLQKAQSERYANMLVYTLGILLLLAIAALAYLWRQRSLLQGNSDDALSWWRKDTSFEKNWTNSLRDTGISAMPGEAKPEKESSKEAPAPKPGESGFAHDKHFSGYGYADSAPPVSLGVRQDFSNSMLHLARAVKAEELVDVQQQADFFVSLDQHDQAIDVLRSHIGGNVQTSALVYLDLFDLYHQLNREADYEALREDFNQNFNAKVPAFALYSHTSSGLEAYESAMSRIEALWPSPKALEVIEESIFRRPDATTKAFDLEAYRELLMLYGVAKEIIKPELGTDEGELFFDLPEVIQEATNPQLAIKASKFMATSIQPLSATVQENKHQKTVPTLLAVLPKPSPRLGLDIDLSELASDNEGAHPVPDSDLGNVIEFDFSDSHINSSGRKKS